MSLRGVEFPEDSAGDWPLDAGTKTTGELTIRVGPETHCHPGRRTSCLMRLLLASLDGG